MKVKSIVRLQPMIPVFVGLTLASAVVWASGGCGWRPGPRCWHALKCPSQQCIRYCTIDPTFGFFECEPNGGSEEKCAEFQVYDWPVWEYVGSCSGGVCQYPGRAIAFYTGTVSQDVSPCGY